MPNDTLSSCAPGHGRRIAVAVALLAAVAAWCAYLAGAARAYHGDLTAFLWVGDARPVPESLSGFPLFVHRATHGYDGQFYYYLATDPLLHGDAIEGMDTPQLRARRILMPLLAFAASLGDPRLAFHALLGLQCLFIAFGAYCLGRLAADRGHSAWWGLAFVAIPGVLISWDRMLTDGPFTALCVAAFWLDSRRARLPLLAVLCAAPLLRETGVLLLGGFFAAALFRRDWRWAAALALAGLPGALWYLRVQLALPHVEVTYTSSLPLGGIVEALLQPFEYASFGGLAWLPRLLDRIGLLGALAAMALLALVAFRRRGDAIGWTCLAFLGLAVMVNPPDMWTDVVSYGRSMSPLFVFPALYGIATGRVAWVLPLLLPLPRVLLQFAGQFL